MKTIHPTKPPPIPTPPHLHPQNIPTLPLTSLLHLLIPGNIIPHPRHLALIRREHKRIPLFILHLLRPTGLFHIRGEIVAAKMVAKGPFVAGGDARGRIAHEGVAAVVFFFRAPFEAGVVPGVVVFGGLGGAADFVEFGFEQVF